MKATDSSDKANSDNQTVCKSEDRSIINKELQQPPDEAIGKMANNATVASTTDTFNNQIPDKEKESSSRVPEERLKKDAASSSSVSSKSIVQKQQQTQKQRQKQMRLRTPSWAQSTTTTKTYLYSSI